MADSIPKWAQQPGLSHVEPTSHVDGRGLITWVNVHCVPRRVSKGAGSEIEQLGLEPVPLWNASFAPVLVPPQSLAACGGVAPYFGDGVGSGSSCVTVLPYLSVPKSPRVDE